MKRISMLAVLTAAVWATFGGGVALAETLEERVSKLESKVAALEATLKGVTRNEKGVAGKPTIQFSGVNVQVVDGEGKTTCPPDPEHEGKVLCNGEGNLVIGYDENASKPLHEQTGSHDLILGEEQTFTSFGGIDAGYKNAIRGEFASATGGYQNQANGPRASVSGGYSNRAYGNISSISGGTENLASETFSSISGGHNGKSSGPGSWIGGGTSNTSSGLYSAVSGGVANNATGYDSSVSGGAYNTANEAAAISGGEHNTATAYWSSISGGEDNETIFGPEGAGEASWIGGGYDNRAEGKWSAVVGGDANKAGGRYSSILGGKDNLCQLPHFRMTGEVKGEAKSPSKIIKLSAATKEISVGMLVIAPGFAPEETTVTKVNSETEIEVAAAYSHTESGEIEFETGFCHFP